MIRQQKLARRQIITEMVINTNGDIADILMEQGKLRQAEQLLLETLQMIGARRWAKVASICPGLFSIEQSLL